MDKQPHQESRLAWMDVLRGLLIILVVVGHSTGVFNKYIYQFHMGAFFLVSGYMSVPERRSPLHTLYHRFLTAYLPILSATVFLAAATAVMRRIGLYSVFLGDSLYLGFFSTVKHIVLYGSLYVWWLGACWFVLALFGAAVINRFLLRLCRDSYNWVYILFSTALLFAGYRLAEGGGVWYSIDLMLIAQFYFMLGTLVRRNCRIDPEENPLARNLCGALVTGFVIWFVAKKYGLTVDYPDRKFSNPVVDVAMSLNGTLCVYFLSGLLCKIPPVKQLLQQVGKNTLPIVIFHFIWFNLGYILLYLAGLAPFEYLQSFTPGEIGAPWWPMFTLIGTGMSILTWKVMMRFRFLRILFGQEKQLYNRWWFYLRSRTSAICKKFIFH